MTLGRQIYLFLVFSLSLIQISIAQPLKEGNLFRKAVVKYPSMIMSAPGSGSSKVSLREFDIVYIYKERGDHYQVGTGIKAPEGYLPKNAVQDWNTRICLHFTALAGRKPALIFGDSRALEDCLSGSSNFYDGDTPNSNAVAQEPETAVGSDRYSMLLPVLSKERVSGRSGIKNIYEVGFLAGNPGASSKSSTSRTYAKGGRTTAKLELMFLLDATGSMNPFIRATKDIIIDVSKRILASRESGVSFGITAYRDYIDQQDKMGFVTNRFIDLNESRSTVLRVLEEVHAAKADSEEPPEAVFDGYFAAITETGWSKDDNTLRIVVLIGDASGHDPSHPKNPTKTSLKDCVNKASEKRVRTIAVKIYSGREEDDELSKSQFYEITEGLTAADKGTFVEAEYPDSEGDAAITEFITNTSKQVEQEILRLERMIKIVDEGGVDKSTTAHSLTSSDRAIILKNIKIAEGGTDPFVFSTGWINEWDNEDRKVVDAFAYLTKDEFDKIISYLRIVDQFVVNPDMAMSGLLEKAIEAVSGEPVEGRDLAMIYKKTLDLPIKTDILRIPSEEIDKWGADRKEKMVNLIKRKMNSIEKYGNNLDNWKTVPGSTSEQYIFIPLDLLP